MWRRVQEMAWFDVDEHASGAVAGRLATDAAYLRGAVGDQVAVIAQNLVTCIAGFTLGAHRTIDERNAAELPIFARCRSFWDCSQCCTSQPKLSLPSAA